MKELKYSILKSFAKCVVQHKDEVTTVIISEPCRTVFGNVLNLLHSVLFVSGF